MERWCELTHAVFAVYENETRQDERQLFQDAGARVLRTNFRKIERREWWLWVAAAIITLLLTIALASFLLPNSSTPKDFHALYILPQAVRGLVALVFLFDLYTIYQHLSPKEFALLEFLMRYEGQPVSRTAIVEQVWKLNFDTMTNVVDVYINYLRRKVDSGYDRALIRTIRGVGYQIGGNGQHA